MGSIMPLPDLESPTLAGAAPNASGTPLCTSAAATRHSQRKTRPMPPSKPVALPLFGCLPHACGTANRKEKSTSSKSYPIACIRRTLKSLFGETLLMHNHLSHKPPTFYLGISGYVGSPKPLEGTFRTKL
ncbi:hypothetical protein PIB30_039163 [Stylosanthes scabra]|uniref:Uncharacterized protein n=1 Tax=Stylosanthes scabra TaxID=79078 RepID=A0ABU6WFC0_9FABA|nr:hypothetical protein [Stylosanthes scabra]